MTNDEYWELHDEKPDSPRGPRVFRCRDRMCGGLDCATCYGEEAALDWLAQQDEDDKPLDTGGAADWPNKD